MKNRKRKSASRQATKSSPRQADKPIESLDDFGDEGTTGLWSTNDLPQSGHDDAIDDGQQKYKSASILMRAASFLESKKDLITARRLRALANEVAPGIREEAKNDPDLFSTEPHEEPAQDGGALDDGNKEGALQLYGTHPTSPGNAGPEERTAKKTKTPKKTAAAGDWDEGSIDDDDDYWHDRNHGQYGEEEEDVDPWEETPFKNDPRPRDPLTPKKRKASKSSTRIQPPQKKPRVRTASGSKSPTWDTIKKALKSRTAAGGSWGKGGWESRTEDFGRSLSLNIDTHNADGTPLLASTVTFNFLGEDKKSRVARIEVADNALHHEVREVEVSARNAAKLADHWAQQAELVGKSYLEE